MSDGSESTFGQRVAHLRTRRGMSQKDLAAEVRRSESWVSQVERDVLPVERVSMQQKLADALSVSRQELCPEETTTGKLKPEPRRPDDLDALRVAMTGHPALAVLFGQGEPEGADIETLRSGVERAWQLAHGSRFTELSTELVGLVASLETAVRRAPADARSELRRLLASAYQAASAVFARQDEPDAAWIAADRAIHAAERSGDPLGVVAGLYRMAHAFIRLGRMNQAERIAGDAAEVLRLRTRDAAARPEELSLHGAMHLVLAVINAKENNRAAARGHIDTAREIATGLGEDRNDYGTEFGPANVEIHAVSIAADLGDAGEALDLAARVDISVLSPERQARFLVDVARAHGQRRQIGEALAALRKAEELAPEQVLAHHQAHDTIRDLVQIAGRRAPDELLDLAHRVGAVP